MSTSADPLAAPSASADDVPADDARDVNTTNSNAADEDAPVAADSPAARPDDDTVPSPDASASAREVSAASTAKTPTDPDHHHAKPSADAPSSSASSSASSLATELATLRARCAALEDELAASASARDAAVAAVEAGAVKSEEALGGALRAARAMSAAQKAKIEATAEEMKTLEADLAAARGDADVARKYAETLEKHLADAAADANAATRRHEETRAADADAANRRVEEYRADARRMATVHAAARMEWAAELVAARRETMRNVVDAAAARREEAARAAAVARRAVCAGGRVAEKDAADAAAAESAPGEALGALFAATTPSKTARRRRDLTSRSASPGADAASALVVEGLLRDAMEDEISASLELGYCYDDEDGSVIVGAAAIVQRVIAKYEDRRDERDEDEDAVDADASNAAETGTETPRPRTSRERTRRVVPLFDADAAGPEAGPAKPRRDPLEAEEARRRFRAFESPSGSAPEDEDAWASERAVLVAELRAAREETEAAKMKLRATSAFAESTLDESDSESARWADGEASNAASDPARVHSAASHAALVRHYEALEEDAVTRLNLAGEVRARRAEAELTRLREKAVTPAQLRAAMSEIRALKAQLAAVRDTAAMAARVVTPTVRSAMECLRLERGGTETDVGGNALAETTNAGSAPSTMRTPRRSIAVRVAEAEAEAARRVLDAATRRAEAAAAAATPATRARKSKTPEGRASRE